MSAVYFIKGRTTGAIKIGVTSNLDRRFAAIKNATAEPVILLGAVEGDVALERVLHSEFSDHRVNGEWFSPSAALTERIAGILAAMPPPEAVLTTDCTDEFTGKTGVWLRVIEEGEARRLGCRAKEVRASLAVRLNLTGGYIENLQRGRVRTAVSARDFFAIREEYIAELERQIAETNEMVSLLSAETQLAAAREILSGEVK